MTGRETVTRTGKAKVLIVDDHQMVREGLVMRISLEPDLVVCGEAAGEDEALSLVPATKPDVVLIDIRLKQGDGIDLVKKLAAHHPSLKLLVLSAYEETVYAERALRAGAAGYMNKQESQDHVIEAIQTVLAGKRYISPETTSRLVNQALTGTSPMGAPGTAPDEILSDRELEVFKLIGQGIATGVIAKRLRLSVHTIDTHRENIKRKLSLKNASDLNRSAFQWLLDHG